MAHRQCFEMQLGHVWICPCMFQKVFFRWFLSNLYVENKWFNFPWIWILFIYWSRGWFLWMVQPKSRFRNLKRIHGTTQREISHFEFHIHFHWPHGVFHQKLRRWRNLQFLCSLWQLRFFLNVNFKTPPALHSVAKCLAASTQLWCL